MPPSPEIHGHDIIDLVAAHPHGLSIDALTAEAATRFGAAARFHTCSADGMTLGQLLDFLGARDKVRVVGSMVYPGGSPACNH